MTTTSFKMIRYFIACSLLAVSIAVVLFGSCTKADHPHNDNGVSIYSSDVLDKWMSMQIRLMKNATGIPNQTFSRHYVYAGITALEAVAPGLPAHTTWSGKWNSLTGLPVPSFTFRYYYPANVNAAMAAINKAMFPNASQTDKMAIDSLEAALNQSFLAKESQSRIDRCAEFGKAVAAAVFSWAESDGYKNANNAYTPPVGAGLWKPTPPAFANASTPYWGSNRTVVDGSLTNTHPGGLPVYSTDPTSSFFMMAKQLYDVSQNLTSDQMAMATFWRDVPGVTSPGHWLSILQQVMRKTNTRLDKAALAYALTGSAINDALIGCWKAKYQYNVVRPITYIRETLGHSSWNSYLGTPPHPEYSSAHSTLSGAAAAILEKLFGNIGSFTDHTYDYLGFPPRTYTSFTAMSDEAGLSRLYAGIHYMPSIDAGLRQGRKVAAAILGKNNKY